MRFVLASNNQKKKGEMSAILQELGIEVLSMEEAGVHTQPEEDGETFEENALIKARAACKASGLPALADDSGLAVDALGGAPGIHSARYCPGSDWDRLQFLLHNMKDIPREKRGARFVSAVACVFPDGTERVWRGECPGLVLEEPQGQGGFGYDPGPDARGGKEQDFPSGPGHGKVRRRTGGRNERQRRGEKIT